MMKIKYDVFDKMPQKTTQVFAKHYFYFYYITKGINVNYSLFICKEQHN